jgi:hypothetical protein
LHQDAIFNNADIDAIVESYSLSLDASDRSHLQLIWDLWKVHMSDSICPVVKQSSEFLNEWTGTPFDEADFREGYLPYWRTGSTMDTSFYPCLVNGNL